MGTLTALPWQDVLVPGQVAELMSCLELPPEKDPVPSWLQESPRPGSRWQKLLKKWILTSLLGWVPEVLRLWLVRAEARCWLPVSRDRASQLGLGGAESQGFQLSLAGPARSRTAQEAKEKGQLL